MPTDPIHRPGDVAGAPVVPHSTQRRQKRRNSSRQRRQGRRGGEAPPDLSDPEALKKLVDTDPDDTEHVDYLA